MNYYYDVQLSSSTFGQHYLKTFKKANVSESIALQNFIGINIFFSSMVSQEIEERPAYTWLALLSDVGGAFGLILGSTVLTVFEFVDFLAVLIVDLFGMRYLQKK